MSASSLPGTRVVQIAISQLFQMVDLLTYPDSVRARGFLKAIRDPNAMRRALNRPLEIQIGQLGKLRPVATAQDRFWRSSKPDLRLPGTPPLFFLPFELSLSDRVASGFAPGADLAAVLGEAAGRLENCQVRGRLRIYPPGTGVVQMAVTLTFRETVDVDAVLRVAQHMEDLLFVDPAGEPKPPSELFFDVIGQVDKAFFLEGNEDRRWQPPQTIYSLRDGGSSDPAPWLPELARLMAPGDQEQAGFLESRLREALRSTSWRTERTLAIAGQDVALLIAGLEPRDKRNARLELLAETHELVSAAAYAEQAFIKELDRIVAEDQLWLPGQGSGFDFLLRLLDTMSEVLRAVASVRFLEGFPCGCSTPSPARSGPTATPCALRSAGRGSVRSRAGTQRGRAPRWPRRSGPSRSASAGSRRSSRSSPTRRSERAGAPRVGSLEFQRRCGSSSPMPMRMRSCGSSSPSI